MRRNSCSCPVPGTPHVAVAVPSGFVRVENSAAGNQVDKSSDASTVSVTSSARRLRGNVTTNRPAASKPVRIAPGPEAESASLVPRAYSTSAGRPSLSPSRAELAVNVVASVPPGVPLVVALVRQATETERNLLFQSEATMTVRRS